MEKRSMPICFTNEQYKKIEEYGKKHGQFYEPDPLLVSMQ